MSKIEVSSLIFVVSTQIQVASTQQICVVWRFVSSSLFFITPYSGMSSSLAVAYPASLNPICVRSNASPSDAWQADRSVYTCSSLCSYYHLKLSLICKTWQATNIKLGMTYIKFSMSHMHCLLDLTTYHKRHSINSIWPVFSSLGMVMPPIWWVTWALNKPLLLIGRFYLMFTWTFIANTEHTCAIFQMIFGKKL